MPLIVALDFNECDGKQDRCPVVVSRQHKHYAVAVSVGSRGRHCTVVFRGKPFLLQFSAIFLHITRCCPTAPAVVLP
jgi:hypothetical protein